MLYSHPTKEMADLLDEGISMSVQQNFLVSQSKTIFAVLYCQTITQPSEAHSCVS